MKPSVSVLGVIPARYDSKRFPGKALADIKGKPMIQWVHERASEAREISRLVIATDDKRIYEVARSFGAEVEMTAREIRNGSERAAAVAEKHDDSIVVNIQGDEPLIDPGAIDAAIRALIDDDEAVASTLVKKIDSIEELTNVNMPKVILDYHGYALYFSRAIIPYYRDEANPSEWIKKHSYFRHIGLYAYRKSFLKRYVGLPETGLERAEKLEQLRILEHGYKIKATIVNYAPRGVDTPDDLESLIQYIEENDIGQGN
jgi:3-deoxy-manno-octulosonate cytidylyltransferase (CMP-KDO synthetase)